ncbi:glycosyltransferase [Nocardioides sp. Arc9.136]|uniref:glycosyltransferase n=1 Tax=Nocardioides sp. Arc9.136 TaxID=2996826 RepID=UPI00266712A7|nr:glycosyltransferase [Nocardioides sp. Arc9.136]WKN50162.1 glycosyltransferase [Nocardioides sp. Arc9.136]
MTTVLVNAGPWLPVPPGGYGGIENVVATLVPELRRLGVRVVLATVGTSELEVDELLCPLAGPRFESVAAPYNQVSGIAHAHMHEVAAELRRRTDVDVVHDHLEVVGPAVLAAMGRSAPPALQTLHWDLRKHADFYERFDGGGRVRFAAVSRSQLERAPENLRAQAMGVVPLAVPTPAGAAGGSGGAPGEHALVLARITADKGQDVAVRVARAAGVPLVLAGPVAGIGEPGELRERLAAGEERLLAHPDVRYWCEEVAPHVDGEQVRWVGCVGGEEKERLLRSARALLTPIRWAEPGATAVVEALGRGVPVVGTPLGVLPTLVEHGVTGFLADTEAGLAACLRDVGRIRAEDCRAAAARWTPEAMARSYLDLYDALLEAAG